jgi:hypothetical protein
MSSTRRPSPTPRTPPRTPIRTGRPDVRRPALRHGHRLAQPGLSPQISRHTGQAQAPHRMRRSGRRRATRPMRRPGLLCPRSGSGGEWPLVHCRVLLAVVSATVLLTPPRDDEQAPPRAPPRFRYRVNWALAAGTWQRVIPRRRAVRGPPQPGLRCQRRPRSRLWLRRPLPPSCAIGWTCQTCGRAVIDARVRHQRRRQPGEHFGLRQPGLQVMDDGAQEP